MRGSVEGSSVTVFKFRFCRVGLGGVYSRRLRATGRQYAEQMRLLCLPQPGDGDWLCLYQRLLHRLSRRSPRQAVWSLDWRDLTQVKRRRSGRGVKRKELL